MSRMRLTGLIDRVLPGGKQRSAVRLFNSTAQSIANSTWQALTFDTQVFCYDSMHSTSSNSNRITIRTPGIYCVGGTAEFAINATGARNIGIRLNATSFQVVDTHDAASATVTRITVTTLLQLNANDYLEFMAYQNSGAALNIQVGTQYTPLFWAFLCQ